MHSKLPECIIIYPDLFSEGPNHLSSHSCDLPKNDLANIFDALWIVFKNSALESLENTATSKKHFRNSSLQDVSLRRCFHQNLQLRIFFVFVCGGCCIWFLKERRHVCPLNIPGKWGLKPPVVGILNINVEDHLSKSWVMFNKYIYQPR